MRKRSALLAAAAAALSANTALADLLPRSGAAAGAVIARKSGEEARFIEVADWRTVDIRQDLLPGDVLRTNATGNLAILFSDRTQVRLGRNSTLVVRKVGGGGADTELSLESGQLWARAERGGEGVAVATPAATAAIRGTDWSMQVDGTGRTSLIVLEGTVELANAQGSVTVRQGEGASASIGQAPTRLVLVNPDDREQMLYYYSLRTAFSLLPTAMRRPGDTGEAARIQAKPSELRSAEERVTLAEGLFNVADDGAVMDAVADARRNPLSHGQAARLDLLEAVVAGKGERDADAARLFARAAGGLEGERRSIALFGGYFSRALLDPERVEAPPRAEGGTAAGALAEAFTASFLQDVPAAIRLLKAAEARFPQDATLPAVRARFAQVAGDREQMREASERALALDPDNVEGLVARSTYRSDFESDIEGALADARRLVEIAPGLSDGWNSLGLVLIKQGATREAEAALRRAIALAPREALPHTNLGVLLTDQNRLKEAEQEFDAALSREAGAEIALSGRGRLRIQQGRPDEALQDLLAASTTNPADAVTLLLLAAAHYEAGDPDASKQALDNADRLDPDDPVIANFRAGAAIADYDTDLAIASAQEALRRSRARGGSYSSLGANRDQGSMLGEAFRLQGLDAWARFYGDALFDPFAGAGFTDQSVAGSPNPFVTDLDFGGGVSEPAINSNYVPSLFQGLLLDPTRLASPDGKARLLAVPFLEATLGAGFVKPDGGKAGRQLDAELEGFTALPFPISFSGTFKGRRADDLREGETGGASPGAVRFDLEDDDVSGLFYGGAVPTPDDRFVVFADLRRDKDNLLNFTTEFDAPVPDTVPGFPGLGLLGGANQRDITDDSLSAGVGYSHTFGYRNVLNAGLFAAGFERSSTDTQGLAYVVPDPPRAPVGLGAIGTTEASFRQDALIGAVSHSIGVGGLTFRYGAEGGRVGSERSERSALGLLVGEVVVPVAGGETGSAVDYDAGRAYLDLLYDVTPSLKAEAGLFATRLRSSEYSVDDEDAGEIAVERLEPRVGLAWEALPGQWLRLGFLREPGAFASASLAPVGVVGLQSNQLPLAVDGYADTFAARWDAEWTPNFFTSLDVQHQEFDGLEIPTPGTVLTTDLEEGRIDRVSLTGNLHVAGGFGLFGTVAYADSENETPGPGFGEEIPFVPELSGRAGITYVSPANLKVTLATSYVGERRGRLGGGKLDDYFTTDAVLTWEPFNRRMALEFGVYNIFDEKFAVSSSDVAPGLGSGAYADVPGWSRTVTGSLKVRF